MMRWTIPTLIYTLYRNGLELGIAACIVEATYAVTQGDDDFEWSILHDPPSRIVGPYALREAFRGEYPADAPTHAGADARTIAAALRPSYRLWPAVVDDSFGTTQVITAIVDAAVEFIRQGGVVPATELEPDRSLDGPMATLQQAANHLDGIADYINDIPLPIFRGF